MPVQATEAQEVWERYCYARDFGHHDFLVKADKCDSFFAGRQWSEQDMNLLRLQKRPAMTINKIISTCSTILGEQIYNRTEVLYRPKNGAPAEVAEALTKVWMQISQNNQLPWVRSDVFCDGIVRSRGFYDMRMDFDDSMRGEIRIEQLNSKNVVVDPDADSYDPDDWGDVMITKWLSPQQVEMLYNKDDAEYLKNAESVYTFGYDSIDTVRDRFGGRELRGTYSAERDKTNVRRNIRVIERQFTELVKREHFVDVVTGDTRLIPSDWDRNRISRLLELSGGQTSTMKKKAKQIRWRSVADNVVLHDEVSPYKHFSVVPYFPFFRYGETLGLVEHLLGPQEILNKTSSQELHIINTTANSGWKVKAGALKNMTVEELRSVGAQTGLVLELDDIANADKITPNSTPTGLDRISYKAEEHIKSISGVSDSMQGFDREDVAAKAIAYKQQRGSVNLTKVMDNLERTDFILARNAVDLVQQYYTEERIIDITHHDVTREPETLTVNQYDEGTGQIVNDLTIGEFDVVVTTTPHRASLEDSQFEQARGLREIGVEIPDSVLIENSRLQRRADIIKQMEGDKESPEAQAQAELAMRAQQAEVANAEAEAQSKSSTAQLNQVRAQKEAQEMQSGGADAAALAKVQMDAQIRREEMEMEFALKQEQMEREFALKREAQAEEMALKREMAEEEARARRADQLRQQAQQAQQPAAET